MKYRVIHVTGGVRNTISGVQSFIKNHIKTDDEEFEEEKADGFVENNLDIVVAKESGVPQSVLKNVVTQIKQVQSLGKSASTIDFKKSWITETKSDVSEGTMMFYSSLASFAMYSIFSGVVCVAYMNGNLSEVGRRVMGSSDLQFCYRVNVKSSFKCYFISVFNANS